MKDLYPLGLLLHRASSALSKAFNAAFIEAGIDLPHSQYIVLRAIYEKDGQSQWELSNMLKKDAAAIKRTVDNLEQKGLVERKTVRTLKNAVHITDKGRALMPRVLDIAQAITLKAYGNLPEDKREKVLRALDSIYTNLQ